jgi:hypothetical protein
MISSFGDETPATADELSDGTGKVLGISRFAGEDILAEEESINCEDVLRGAARADSRSASIDAEGN